FRIAGDNCIGVRSGIIGYERHVRTAHYDSDATRAKVRCKFVSAACSTGDDRQTHHIDIEVGRNISNSFVETLDGVRKVLRNECSQRGQGERLVAQGLLPDAATVPVQRTLWRNERN